MPTREFLRSDCGRYFAKPLGNTGTDYELYDGSGNCLGKTTWWSNEGTNTRIAFEIGVGSHSAHFGYPRKPTWFKRRWVECFEIDLKDLVELAKTCGCEVLVGYKPDLNCYHHLGLKCPGGSLAKFDKALLQRNLPYERRQRGGQWNIECPSKARRLRLHSLPTGG